MLPVTAVSTPNDGYATAVGLIPSITCPPVVSEAFRTEEGFAKLATPRNALFTLMLRGNRGAPSPAPIYAMAVVGTRKR